MICGWVGDDIKVVLFLLNNVDCDGIQSRYAKVMNSTKELEINTKVSLCTVFILIWVRDRKGPLRYVASPTVTIRRGRKNPGEAEERNMLSLNK